MHVVRAILRQINRKKIPCKCNEYSIKPYSDWCMPSFKMLYSLQTLHAQFDFLEEWNIKGGWLCSLGNDELSPKS